MSERLEVLQDQTYTIAENETIEYAGLDNYGQVDVHGELSLVDNPDLPEPTVSDEWSLDLPLEPLNLRSMDLGLSVFLVGSLGLLLGAAAFLRNYAAGILWGFSVITLLFSGLFGIGLELFWTGMTGTVLLLIAGMVVRSMQ